nr:unnamed protein product [Digitaria exilis]
MDKQGRAGAATMPPQMHPGMTPTGSDALYHPARISVLPKALFGCASSRPNRAELTSSAMGPWPHELHLLLAKTTPEPQVRLLRAVPAVRIRSIRLLPLLNKKQEKPQHGLKEAAGYRRCGTGSLRSSARNGKYATENRHERVVDD